MKETKLLRRWPLCATATAISAAGLLAGAAPAHALPEVPLAPGNCQQWAFPGPVTVAEGTGETISFNATGPNAGGPAPLTQPNGVTKQGTISGGIDANGHVTLTWVSKSSNTPYNLVGDVGPDGRVNGTREPSVAWNTTGPMTCATAAAAAPAAPTGKDSDGDGLSDRDELTFFTNLFLADTDFDGVSDGDEIKNRTNPVNALSS